MPDESKEEALKSALTRNKNALDDYLASVKGIYAFASSACWDDSHRCLRTDSHRCAPRTMKTHSKGGEVNLTPDCVVQVTPKYGIVAEMKKHYQDDDLRPYDQIRKYDSDLIGWWTPNELIDKHDLVLITHYFSSTSARDAYRLWQERNEPYSRKFAIVEFTHSEQGQSYFALKRVEGTLSDETYSEKLRRGIKIPDSVFIEITSRYKFYDAKPPLIHMLVLLQDYIFPTMFSEEQYDQGEDGIVQGVEVSVTTVRQRLEEQFCDKRQSTRQPVLPKVGWVKEALETLASMDLAKKRSKDTYHVFLRKPSRKDSVAYFTAKLFELEKRRNRKEQNPEQGLLFSA
jgi:hypothetical protein